MTGTTTGTPAARWSRRSTAPREPVHGPGAARPARLALLDVLALLVALAAAVLPLVPAFTGALAVPALVGGLLVGAAVAAGAARRGWTALATLAVLLVAFVLVGGPLTVPTTTVAGFVPTGATVGALLAGTVTVWRDVLTLQAPLGPDGGTLVAPYMLAVAGAASAVGLALRGRTPTRAALAAGVPPLVGIVAVVLGTRDTLAPVTTGLAAAVTLLTWVSWRTGRLAARRVLALLLTTAVAGVGGAVVGPAVADLRPRHVVRDEIVPPFDPREHPSPLAGYRRFVKDWRETPLVTVRGLPAGVPVRLATLDAYDGVVWSVAPPGASDGSGTFRRPAGAAEPADDGVAVTVGVEAHGVPGVWLPSVGDPTAVRFTGAGPSAAAGPAELADRLRVNTVTGAVVLTGGVPQDVRYTLRTSVPAVPDDAAIAAAAPADVDLPAATAVPDVVGLVAREMAGQATTPLAAARALEAGLSERGWFSHGLPEAGDHPSLSGHGAGRMTSLLSGEPMVGDSEQYASAMALMARELGLPARVVLGWRPEPQEAGADVTLLGGDAEAWVEIAFAGHGWVPFDPTPDESRTPDDRAVQDDAEPEPQVVQPPPPLAEPVVPPEEDTEQPRTDDPSSGDRAAPVWRQVATVAAVAGLPLVLVLAPAVVLAALRARRRRRRRSAPDAVDRVVGGWEEMLDAAADLALAVPAGGTRSEAAALLARCVDVPVEEPLRALAGRTDAAVFAPGRPADAEVDGVWASVDAVVAQLRAAVPQSRRVRARWSTASLRRRGRRATASPRRPRPHATVSARATRPAGATGAAPTPPGPGVVPAHRGRTTPTGPRRRPSRRRPADRPGVARPGIGPITPTPQARGRAPRDGES